jgi:hypothetical protein
MGHRREVVVAARISPERALILRTAADAGNCAACGAFLPGNSAALVHGLSRFRDGHPSPLDVRERDATWTSGPAAPRRLGWAARAPPH